MNNRHLAGAALLVASIGMVACNSNAKLSIGAGSTTVAHTEPPVASIDPTGSTTATSVHPVTTPAVTDTTLPKHALWDKVELPKVPTGHTDPFPSSGVLGDGKYWAEYHGGAKLMPDVTVIQVFFGKECETQAAAHSDECLNDIYALDKPNRSIHDLPFHDNAFLTVSDQSSQLSYWITPAELVKIRASSPSAGAPAGFGYVPFAFLMTVRKGEITRFEQVWTP